MQFTDAVERVRSGHGTLADTTAQFVDELTMPERLGLLDGDGPFIRSLLDWGRHWYNHRPVVAGAVDRVGLPGIRFTDGPRGIVMGRSTAFPVAMARGATWDVDLEEEIGRVIGLEGRAQGANLFAGVCVNLLRHPGWGRAQETYGEDPVLLGEMGAALTRGVRPQLMACVKHFAANSIENSRFVVDVECDDDVLHEVYLPHFRRIIEEGAESVMSAYNSVNGEWCGDSPALLTHVLRDEWGFSGFVMSDFLLGHRDPVGSVAAGLDLEMPFRQQRAAALPKALDEGRLRADDVVASCRRLVAAQIQHALYAEPAPDPGVVACGAHRQLARRAAAQSMVLLRNEAVAGRAVLPLDPSTIRRVAVVGRLATLDNLGDMGSSWVRPPATVAIVDGLRARLGATASIEEPDVADAASVAAGCDVAVVVVGFTARDEGEAVIAPLDDAARVLPGVAGSRPIAALLSRGCGAASASGRVPGGDRSDLRLRRSDEELIARVAAACPRTIVVLVAGSAVVAEEWREQVPAIVVAWYPGMEGGNALADVLVGDVEPGGRLPFAVPTDSSHLPEFDPTARRVRYDRWWGQRQLDRDGNSAAFPLGFGLGYTSWRHDSIDVNVIDNESAVARVDVTNVGDRRGSTVVQVYAVDREGHPSVRSPRQLIGFTRVSLDAGAAARVEVPLSLRPLRRRVGPGRWEPVGTQFVIEAARYWGDPEAAITNL